MAIVTPTDRRESVRDRCVIEVFGGVFVLSRCFLDFSVGVGAFVIGQSQISFFFSLLVWSLSDILYTLYPYFTIRMTNYHDLTVICYYCFMWVMFTQAYQINPSVTLASEPTQSIKLTVKLSGCSSCGVQLSRKPELSVNLRQSLVKAWIKHIVDAKTIIKHDVVAKASIFITFSYEKNNPARMAGEKNNLAPILSEKNSGPDKTPSPPPPPNIKWTVP